MSQNPNGLLEYIPGSHALLVQKNSSPPLEGFTENIKENIHEYAEDSKSEVEKGNKFLQWILTRVFEATEDDAADAIVDGANDLGIDAYLPVDFSDNTVRLFQSKYGTSHSLEAIAKFKEDAKRLLSKDITKSEWEGTGRVCGHVPVPTRDVAKWQKFFGRFMRFSISDRALVRRRRRDANRSARLGHSTERTQCAKKV